MTVSDNTIQAENLGDFFKNPGKKRLNVKKKHVRKRFEQSNNSFRYYSKHCYSRSL